MMGTKIRCSRETGMKPFVIIGGATGLAILPTLLLAQTPPAGRGNAVTPRQSFEKFTVEGQPIDRRAPELGTDHPVFPGQTHAPYHRTTDVAVTTIASGLDNPWAVVRLPSGRFLITEKPGRIPHPQRGRFGLSYHQRRYAAGVLPRTGRPPRRRVGSELSRATTESSSSTCVSSTPTLRPSRRQCRRWVRTRACCRMCAPSFRAHRSPIER